MAIMMRDATHLQAIPTVSVPQPACVVTASSQHTCRLQMHITSTKSVSGSVACFSSFAGYSHHLSMLEFVPQMIKFTMGKVSAATGTTINNQKQKQVGPVSSRPRQLIRLLHRFAIYPTCGLKVTLLISPECPARVATQLPLIVLYNLRQKAMSTRH